jgi:hypothetical protein
VNRGWCVAGGCDLLLIIIPTAVVDCCSLLLGGLYTPEGFVHHNKGTGLQRPGEPDTTLL